MGAGRTRCTRGVLDAEDGAEAPLAALCDVGVGRKERGEEREQHREANVNVLLAHLGLHPYELLCQFRVYF